MTSTWSSADDDRFAALFEQYYGEIHRYLSRQVAGEGNAAVDDLAEEVFVVAYRRFSECSRAQSPRAWLFGVARRIAANHRRTATRRRSILDRFMRPASIVDDPADALGTADAVHAALSGLSAKDRELLVLLAWDGLSVAEIADVLNLTPANVSVRLHRAKSRFLALYEPLVSTEQTTLEGSTP